MTYCHVSRQIDDYLADCDEQQAREEAIDECINELMAPGAKYDPFSASNLSEAMAELSDEDYACLGRNLESSERAITAQRVIFDHTRKYCGKLAEAEADTILQSRINDNFNEPYDYD